MNRILTLNAGSSSLKFSLYTTDFERISEGMVDDVGTSPVLRIKGRDDEVLSDRGQHAEALSAVMQHLEEAYPDLSIAAVAHRVVHGGPDFTAPARITPDVFETLRTLVPFAPLHQPYNLAAIEAAQDHFPDAVQIACVDTAFHRGQPWESDVFAIPRHFSEQGVRRYGFHGLSYEYLSQRLAEIDPECARGKVVYCHLGNGASAAAVVDGRSVSSTMGFTALDGLPMGTRCGQIDPGVLLYLMEQKSMGVQELRQLLYRESGLLGLSGISHDMRQLTASSRPEAAEAIAYYCHRLSREIAALAADMGGLNGVVFSAGIGENTPRIRTGACAPLGFLDISLDEEANQANQMRISKIGADVAVYVIPTDEESVLATAAIAAISG